ncbi:phage portal protein [Micrococcus luteus]|uniref:phage portal protein n=2 Tax=Micrococcus luteus TaxID=1270 RepID=UPI00380A88A4
MITSIEFPSIPEAEAKAIQTMSERIANHRSRHKLRQHYYEGTSGLRDLGISIPPQLRNMEVALGWPAKAVNSLGQRIQMEGYVLPDSQPSDWGIDRIIFDNRLDAEAPQVHQSTLLHGCSFLATFRGDPSLGEPEVIIQAFPASHATGLYQPTTRALGASLLILDEDETSPTRLLALFPHVIYDLRKDKFGWAVNAYANTLGRVPVELQAFSPSLTRPFGKSFLSRDMMNITDNAMRTVARCEVGAEFFTAPQRYILGADQEVFQDDNGKPIGAWDMMMGRILGLPYNEENEVMPEVGAFPQQSMQPYTDQLRTYAGLFAGASGLPVTSLGIVSDNPASAEGVHAVREDLLVTARDATQGFTSSWVRTMQTAVQLKNNLAEVPEELLRMTVRWADPATPSRSASADAALKLVSAGIIPADSDVALEMVGLSAADVLRIQAHRTRQAAPDRINDLLSGTGAGDVEEATEQARLLKAKADAMGVLIRAGVKSDDAARLAGVSDVEFLPGMPVTLREVETE